MSFWDTQDGLICGEAMLQFFTEENERRAVKREQKVVHIANATAAEATLNPMLCELRDKNPIIKWAVNSSSGMVFVIEFDKD